MSQGFAKQPALDHDDLANRDSVDAHDQYFTSGGLSGGQTITGGTGIGENLVLQSTSNITKGKVKIKDGEFQLENTTDNSKRVVFDLSSLGTGFLRTITVPNSDFTIATESNLNSHILNTSNPHSTTHSQMSDLITSGHPGNIISLDTASFNNNLSGSDDTVQKAFDTLDNIDVSSSIWGNISGTLSNQTDLQNALDLKANLTDITNLFNKVSDDSDNITEGATNLFFTTSERSKLTGIEVGAEINDFNNGGDIAGANRTLGNTDNFDLGFLANNVNRLNITGGGDINGENFYFLQNGTLGQGGVDVFRSTTTQTGATDCLFIGNTLNTTNTGILNIGIGFEALKSNTSGQGNLALGSGSLKLNTIGVNNVGLGRSTLASNVDGSLNVAIGLQALNSNVDGDNNMAIGSGSLTDNVDGTSNTGVGVNSLNNNVDGNSNIGIGLQSLFLNINGSSNVAIGVSCMQNNNASNNSAVGTTSMFTNTTGTFNTAFGLSSLRQNSVGNNNTAVGYNSLYNVLGSGNVALGNQSGQQETGSNKLYIDNSSTTTPLIYGEFDNNLIRINGDFEVVGNTDQIQGLFRGNTTQTNNILEVQNNVSTNLLHVSPDGSLGQGGIEILKTTLTQTGGIDNVFLGDIINTTNTGTGNIAIGKNSLESNTTGTDNVGLGLDTLKLNTIGINNTAIGLNSLESNIDGNSNTGIGASTLLSNTSGNNNLACGTQALFTNTSGSSNVALGPNALLSNTIGNNNVGIGSTALQDNISGSSNTGIGVNSLRNNTIGGSNTAIGVASLFSNLSGNNQTAVGSNALTSNTTGTDNNAFGNRSLQNNISGNNNVAIGTSTLDLNTSGGSNTAVGNSALKNSVSGVNSVAIGTTALFSNLLSNNNTAVGAAALYNNLGVGNVALGNNAGLNETGSNKLYIENSSTSSPLIYGEFDNDLIRINGNFETIGNQDTVQGLFKGNSTQTNNILEVQDSSSNNLIYVSPIGTIGQGGVDVFRTTTTQTGATDCLFIGDTGNTTNTGLENVGIGKNALKNNTTGTWNFALGTNSLQVNSTGLGNVGLGVDTMVLNSSGLYNIAIGFAALRNNDTGRDNIAIGRDSIRQNVANASFNTAIGSEALRSVTGSSNVAIGFRAGKDETGSNKLYIANSETTTPLIYGEFDNNLIRINGDLNVTGYIEIDGDFNHDGTNFGVRGATPVPIPTAYTQTYSTTTRTHANLTSATLTDSTGGTANTTVVAVSGTGDDTNINNGLADLIAQVNALRVDLENTKQIINSMIDDRQADGLAQ